MEWNEKNSRDQPKELWIHGRAVTTAMGMPQPKANENDNFQRKKAARSRNSTQMSIRFDSP